MCSSAYSALSDQKIQALLQEDKESKGKRERFRKLQEALVKLKRVLSLHEARASAESTRRVRHASPLQPQTKCYSAQHS